MNVVKKYFELMVLGSYARQLKKDIDSYEAKGVVHKINGFIPFVKWDDDYYKEAKSEFVNCLVEINKLRRRN